MKNLTSFLTSFEGAQFSLGSREVRCLSSNRRLFLMAILSIACSVVLSVTLVTAVPDVPDAKQAFEKYIKDRDGSVETI